MPTIKDLRVRHPSCDAAERATMMALYEGGKRFRMQLDTFLPKRQAEVDQRHTLRKQEMVYRNYLGPVIDYFTALLFTSRPQAIAKPADKPAAPPPPPTPPDPGEPPKPTEAPTVDVPEFYARFREDADRNGSDIDAVMKDRLTDALVNRISWFVVEKYDDGAGQPDNLADYEKRKLGDCWIRCVDGDEVYDWETDELGLVWALVHQKTQKRIGLSGGRSMVTETWEFFTRDTVETYAVTYEANKPPAETEEVALVGVRVHGFDRVPVVCLELPVGLWVAGRLETPQLAHFRLSNAQMWGMTQTCYAMPVFRVKEDEEGNHRMPKMGAGYGIIIGNEEFMEWAAPPATPYAAMAEEIKSHKDEIYRIAHQMALGVENNATAVGRSADSKHEDSQATKVVLLAYSRLVKECIEYIYDLISRARGEKYEWAIGGLDDFAAADVLGLVEVLDMVELAGGIPSHTFNVAMKQRLAESLLPDMDQQMKETVRKEIEQGVAQKTEDDKKALELGHAHLKAAALVGAPNADPNFKPNSKASGAQPPKPFGRGGGRARPPTPPA